MACRTGIFCSSFFGIFPDTKLGQNRFVAKPVVASIMEKMGYDFNEYIEERKEYAADFVINAIKKN